MKGCFRTGIVPLLGAIGFFLSAGLQAQPASDPPPAEAMPRACSIAGKVTASGPAGLAGVQVVAMSRADHGRYESRSDSNGSYKLSVPCESFDLGFFISGYNTLYYGPRTLLSRGSQTLNASLSKQVAAGTITGEVRRETLWGLVPAARVTVTLRANQGMARYAKLPVAITDAEGKFQLDGVQEGFQDLVFSRTGMEDERFDLVKTKEPAHVQLTLGGVPHPVFVGMKESAVELPSATQQCDVSLERSIPVSQDGTTRYLLQGCGKGTFTKVLGQSVISTGSPCPSGCLEVSVNRDGIWNTPYSIQVWYVGRQQSQSHSVTFVDEAGQSYRMHFTTDDFGQHQLFYDSAKPAIKQILHTYSY